jgi:hypothetical protein
MKKVVLILGVFLAAAVGGAEAQTQVGSTIGTFLRIEPAARGAALGNAGSALPGGVDAVYYNVGALGLLEEAAVQYSHSRWFADIGFDYFAAALPVAGVGNFFLSVTALNSGEIDVRTVEMPLGTGERYTVSNVALGVGFGKRITSRFAAGLQANYVTERIWTASDKMMTFNLGTTYLLSEGGARLAFSLANLGTRARYTGSGLGIQYDRDPDSYGDNSALPAEQATDRFPLPGLFRIGLSVPYQVSQESALLLLVEGLHPNDNSESMNLGVEWKLRRLLALRAGYQTLFQTDGELGLTLGFGVEGDLGRSRYALDYAWAGHEYLEDTHRVTLVIGF